jgi:hypothetical protein
LPVDVLAVLFQQWGAEFIQFVSPERDNHEGDNHPSSALPDRAKQPDEKRPDPIDVDGRPVDLRILRIFDGREVWQWLLTHGVAFYRRTGGAVIAISRILLCLS